MAPFGRQLQAVGCNRPVVLCGGEGVGAALEFFWIPVFAGMMLCFAAAYARS
ncbi:hypothetical protein [Halopseudomonas sp.]|uniref:hypothetical protein n=1 Tax=Halopseudomonas sp. TaxID=2901191 RepID=UPI00311E3E56